MNLQQILYTAEEIARAAGDILRHGYHEGKEIDTKSTDIDLVTQYDNQCEELIVSRLQTAFPDHAIVAEEGRGDDYADAAYRWYIDPLDGTNNFAHGFPQFCVSMALYEGADPLVAVIYDPLRDEFFTAVAGQGARLTVGDKTRRLQVSAADDLLHSLLATGFPYDRHHTTLDNLVQLGVLLKKAQGLRRAGSAALDMAYVAAGRLDGYWEFKLSMWDVAAGVLLVREAGGDVSHIATAEHADLADQPFRPVDNPALYATNGRIHAELAAALHEAADLNDEAS